MTTIVGHIISTYAAMKVVAGGMVLMDPEAIGALSEFRAWEEKGGRGGHQPIEGADSDARARTAVVVAVTPRSSLAARARPPEATVVS